MSHRIEVEMTTRWGVAVSFICDEPDDAPCKRYCDLCNEDYCDHDKVYSRDCGYLPWLDDETSGAEFYAGPNRKDFVSGEIEFVWEGGECMGWRYLTST